MPIKATIEGRMKIPRREAKISTIYEGMPCLVGVFNVDIL
jgi:hypothetical protein